MVWTYTLPAFAHFFLCFPLHAAFTRHAGYHHDPPPLPDTTPYLPRCTFYWFATPVCSGQFVQRPRAFIAHSRCGFAATALYAAVTCHTRRRPLPTLLRFAGLVGLCCAFYTFTRFCCTHTAPLRLHLPSLVFHFQCLMAMPSAYNMPQPCLPSSLPMHPPSPIGRRKLDQNASYNSSPRSRCLSLCNISIASQRDIGAISTACNL